MQHASIRSPVIKADPIIQPHEGEKPVGLEIDPQIHPHPAKTSIFEETQGEKKERPEGVKLPQLNSLQVSLVVVANEFSHIPKKADSMSMLDQSLRSVPIMSNMALMKGQETPKPSSKHNAQELFEAQSISNTSAAANNTSSSKDKEKQQAMQPAKFIILGYEELYATVFYQQKINRWIGHSIEHDDKYFKNHQINHVDASMVLSTYSRDT